MNLPKITRVRDIIQEKTGYPADEMVENVYQKLGHEHFLKRESERRSVTTTEEWRKERARVGKALLDAFGGPLPNEKLKIREYGEIKKKNLTLKKLMFSPFGEHWVSANLYLPANSAGKLPVAILAHGHSLNGKQSLRERGAFFVANGYAALTFDYAGGGERNLLDSNGDVPAFPSAQHNIIGDRMNLCGCNLQCFMLSETIAAVDYVTSLPEIDSERVCMTGASGGGTETFLAAALDERIKVLAPAACVRAHCGEIDADDAEQVWFDAVSAGLGYSDIASFLIAPRPMLIVTNKKDIWDFEQVEYFTREVRGFYKLLGANDNFDRTVRDRGHAYEPDQVEDALRWFNKHLSNDAEFIPHKDVDPEDIPTEEECLVTEKGNIHLSGFDNPIATFAKIAEKRFPPARDKKQAVDRFKRKHDAVLNHSAEIEWEVIDTYQVGEIQGERILFSPEPGLWLPAEILTPGNPKGTAILLNDTHRMSDLDKQLELARRGLTVARPDIRGFGDAANKESWEDWENWTQNVYSGRRHRLAALANMVGRDIVLDRAADISALAKVLRGIGRGGEITVRAKGACVVSAIIAAVFYSDVADVRLESPIPSYRGLLESEFPISHGDEFICGIVSDGLDLPDFVVVAANNLNWRGNIVSFFDFEAE